MRGRNVGHALVIGLLSLLALVPLASGQTAEPGDRVIERELVDLRRERSRTYLLQDGTRLTKVFPGAVNVRGADGVWRDIDTALVDVGDDYSVRRAGYELALPATLSEIEAGPQDSLVRFALHGGAAVDARVNGRSGRYVDALPGVDLRYEALPKALKETLVLKGPDAPGEYVFSLDRGGLRAVPRDDGSIDLLTPGDEVAISIAAPWMVDAAGAHSDAVTQELRTGPGGDELVVRPDPDWLRAPDREFPVEVDPTMYFEPRPSEDCHIDSASPTTSSCLADSLALGWDGSRDHRMLLRFDLAGQIPQGANVEDGYLALFMESKANTQNRQATLYPVTRNWTRDATWNSFDGLTPWTTPGGDFNAAFGPNIKWFGWESINRWYYWGVDDLTQAWVKGDFPNYGLVVKDLNDRQTNNVVRFASSEDVDTTRRPYLGVDWYTAPHITATGQLYDVRGKFLHGGGSLAVRVDAQGPYGVKDVSIEVAGSDRDRRQAPCTPTCPNSFGADMTVDAGALPEGRIEARGRGMSPQNDRDSTPRWNIGIDRSAPTLDFRGSTLNQGGEPLTGDSYTLRTKVIDGSRSTTANERAGARSIEVLVRKDGESQFTSKYFSQDVACATGSCELERSWELRPADYPAGRHTVRVVGRDQLARPGQSDPSGDVHAKVHEFAIVVAPSGPHPEPTADHIGLERWWQYDSTETGAGSSARVNLANGNLVWQFMPIVNRGRGLSTDVNLTYNSLQQKPKPLLETPVEDVGGYNEVGQGFSLGISGLTRLNERLNVDLAAIGRITLTDRDGTRHRFTGVPGTDVFEPPPGVHLHLRRFSRSKTIVEPVPILGFGELEDNDRAWAATAPDGVTHYFDRRGYQTSVEDRNANKIGYSYEYRSATYQACEAAASSSIFVLPEAVCPRKLVAVTDPEGRPLRLRYNAKAAEVADDGAPGVRATASGTLKEATDHAGRVTKFDYTDGYLTRVSQPGGGGNERPINFDYEATGTVRGLTAVTEPGHTHLSRRALKDHRRIRAPARRGALVQQARGLDQGSR